MQQLAQLHTLANQPSPAMYVSQKLIHILKFLTLGTLRMFGNNGYYGHHGHKLSSLDNDFDTIKLQANLILMLPVQFS